jgi:hypothetical protein
VTTLIFSVLRGAKSGTHRNIVPLFNNGEIIKKDDQYYFNFIKNTIGEFNIISKPKNMKRQELEANKFVFSLVDEIHDLIVENKDTYKNPEKLEDIEKEANLKKRNYQQQLYNYGESELIYPISSSGDKVILLGYLPKKLSEKVKKNR